MNHINKWSIIVLVQLIFWPTFLIGQTAQIPYSTGFENWAKFPDVTNYWTKTSADESLVEITSEKNTGINSLKLTAKTYGEYPTNPDASTTEITTRIDAMSNGF